MSNVACDQCGGPVDNTGTVCTGCLQSVMQAAGFKGLVQATSAQRKTLLQPAQPARPLLMMKGTPVSAATPNNDVIYVEYNTVMLVAVDSASGDIDSVEYQAWRKMEPTGNHYADAKATTTVGVPTPPPKFSSIEEAEEWMERHAGTKSYDVEVDQQTLDVVGQVAVGAQLKNWINP